MSSITTITRPEELRLNSLSTHRSQISYADSNITAAPLTEEVQPPEDAFDAIPDGGRDAWLVVFACAVSVFWAAGFPSAWYLSLPLLTKMLDLLTIGC